jgi:hypothetical protein
VGLAGVAALAGCGQHRDAPAAQPSVAFVNSRPVEIGGYAGSAMEPFISCDGRYLFFNNRNEPSEQTDLLFAERSADGTFRFLGPLAGANEPPPVLDAVPSLDVRGELFFVSTRSYETSLATLYRGDFRDGRVEGVRLVPGNISRGQRGWLTMDAEIGRDGERLYFASARFSGRAIPDESDLAVARRNADAFIVAEDSERLLRSLNTSALEYAPSTSADGLEIFFTRLDGATPVILRSARADASAAFGAPTRVGGIDGFAEAPSLTCDGNAIYYHRRDGDVFRIHRAERAR